LELHVPAIWVFLVSLALAVLAVVGDFYPIQFVSAHAFWIAIAAYVVLAVGTLVKTR